MRALHRPPHARVQRSLLLIGLLLLLLPLLLGTFAIAATSGTTTTAYKWRDERGQLHLTDTPPPKGVPYEEIRTATRSTTGHPAASSKGRSASVATVAVTPSTPVEGEALPGTGASGQKATDRYADRRCIETLYQLELVTGKYKVYKPGPDDARTYLDDADRPAEIARLAKARDESCSTEQPLQGAQKRRAAELFQVLSADCREAREKLQRLAQPESRTSRNEYERQEEWVARYCPHAPDADTYTDVWRADRVWRYHRK